jgi:hypothetical protein
MPYTAAAHGNLGHASRCALDCNPRQQCFRTPQQCITMSFPTLQVTRDHTDLPKRPGDDMRLGYIRTSCRENASVPSASAVTLAKSNDMHIFIRVESTDIFEDIAPVSLCISVIIICMSVVLYVVECRSLHGPHARTHGHRGLREDSR